MLTRWADLQRAALKPPLLLARELAPRFDPLGLGHAVLEHALQNLRAGEVRTDDLLAQIAADLEGTLDAQLLEEQPFHRFYALRRRGDRPERRLLLVSPYSGYASRVLSPLIAALLPRHEVLLVDWRDARLVPVEAGPFDLERQVLLVERLILRSAPPVHVIGLSQSTVPVFASVARLAATEPPREPRSTTLIGGPIVPGAPGPHDAWLPLWNQLLDLQAFRHVAAPWPGAGRQVYPCLHQLLLVALGQFDLYAGLQAQALVERAFGRPGVVCRAIEDLHAVIDTPAELVRQTIHEVFQTANLANGRMMVAGEAVDPFRIRRGALLTIEAGRDGLIGRGDTHRAARLTSLTKRQRQHLTLPDAGHPDLFTGPLAAMVVGPAIRAFVARHG